MRAILHCDLNNFFASVECLENNITDKYVAVSGNPDARHGIILAKNTAAKEMGVKTGEAIWEARQKCPELVCVPPHYHSYAHYSNVVRRIYCRYTDLVESFGLDECWLDVTHSKIFGTPYEIAEKLRKEVKQETGLTISVGVSFNKVFAKLGSDMKKPDAVTVISHDNYKQLVWPLKVSEMIFIGKHTEAKLNKMGIFTLGELANADSKLLERTFGINGIKMQNCALGLDDEPVHQEHTERTIKSVGHGTTTLRDMTTRKDIEQVVTFLCEMVATRLRRYGMQGKVVHVNIRHNDLTHLSKQTTIPLTFVAKDIANTAMKLIDQLWTEGRSLPLRSLSVSLGNLQAVGCAVQQSLFDDQQERKERLEISLDQIRKKFGFGAITKANLLNNDLLSDKFFDEEDLIPFKRR